MGAKCCTDRKKEEGKSQSDRKVSAPDKPDRKSIRQSVHANNAYGSKRGISIGYNGQGEDATKFDKAFEENNLKGFVDLLDSQEEIKQFEEKMHPWAEDPKTVGALAGTQLAILASDPENPTVKGEIREAGAIPKLVGFLQSGKSDRVQTAIVAFSFLTADCPENALAAFEAGVMDKYVGMLESPTPGLRTAVATSLRDMMLDNMEARLKFVSLGGTKGLIHQLNAPHDPAQNKADVQLEAVLNVQDFIEDEGGNIIPDIAKEVVKCGGKDELRKLLSSEDQEVRESAEEVLQALEDF
mmetsp:Transcript_11166/g.24645  ORF Transcript_11166/g.24645 Transcript_11166/m.24645 type:complete len:298 (-) Transcript_11166:75-968(-)